MVENCNSGMCKIFIKVLSTLWTICGRRNLQHTDANLTKRYGFTWMSGVRNILMETGYVDIRLVYLFRLFHWWIYANDFIANYLTHLRTSLYAIVIGLFLYSDFHYSPIPKDDPYGSHHQIEGRALKNSRLYNKYFVYWK